MQTLLGVFLLICLFIRIVIVWKLDQLELASEAASSPNLSFSSEGQLEAKLSSKLTASLSLEKPNWDSSDKSHRSLSNHSEKNISGICFFNVKKSWLIFARRGKPLIKTRLLPLRCFETLFAMNKMILCLRLCLSFKQFTVAVIEISSKLSTLKKDSSAGFEVP